MFFYGDVVLSPNHVTIASYDGLPISTINLYNTLYITASLFVNFSTANGRNGAPPSPDFEGTSKSKHFYSVFDKIFILLYFIRQQTLIRDIRPFHTTKTFRVGHGYDPDMFTDLFTLQLFNMVSIRGYGALCVSKPTLPGR